MLYGADPEKFEEPKDDEGGETAEEADRYVRSMYGLKSPESEGGGSTESEKGGDKDPVEVENLDLYLKQLKRAKDIFETESSKEEYVDGKKVDYIVFVIGKIQDFEDGGYLWAFKGDFFKTCVFCDEIKLLQNKESPATSNIETFESFGEELDSEEGAYGNAGEGEPAVWAGVGFAWKELAGIKPEVGDIVSIRSVHPDVRLSTEIIKPE